MEQPLSPDTLRLAAFLSIFIGLAVIERLWPRRPPTVAKARRWRVNLAIVALDTLLVRLIVPMAPVAAASLASRHGWGLFHVLQLSGFGEIAASLLLLDGLIYFQHRFFHRIGLLWRLHRVHHTDLDLDVSSGARFHPLEILLSLAIKLAAVLLFGISPLAALCFEVLLNATSLFNHANLRLPLKVDWWLRLLLVTPDMHRVHHSIIPQETNSNFGFNLPWWDRLFGSYRDQPFHGHDRMTIGLKEWRNIDELGVWSLLVLPFAHPLRKAK